MTNYERIRSMSVEEMAKFILYANSFCEEEHGIDCIHGWQRPKEACEFHAKQWLESEVKE